jgi:DNA-binding transcriptional LysR family regulator
MDRLDAMTLFLAIAEAGSLAGAGRRLRVPVQTVSRKLAALEAHLGARLLTRTTRRLALTEEGRHYAEACQRILHDVDEAERWVAGRHAEPSGSLVLTAPVVFGRLHVLPLLLAFLDAHPKADARLLLVDRVVDLVEEGIDLAVRIGTLPDSSLIARRVGGLRRVACASPEYLDRRGVPSAPEDLARHDCITFAGIASTVRWVFNDDRGDRPVSIRSRLVVTTAEAAVDAAIAGLGVVRLLSYQIAAALAERRLRLLLEAFEPPEAPVNIVGVEARSVPTRVRALGDFLEPRLRRRLTELGRQKALRRG